MEDLSNSGVEVPSEIHPMVSAIQTEIQDPVWNQTSGHFTIPYHKLIDGVQYQLWFRRRNLDFSEGAEIVIDFGSFQNSEDFISLAGVDMAVRDTIDSLPIRAPIKPKIGVIKNNIPMPWFDGIMCYRARDYTDQFMGIYVESALRGNKIGTSLISAARIVLQHENVDKLVVDRIREIDKGTQTGEFYQRLGGRIFYIKGEDPASPKLIIPTAESKRYPYKFF